MFGLCPGSYNTESLIGVPRSTSTTTSRATRSPWSGTTSRRTAAGPCGATCAASAHWLVVEYLPPYAYDLNPVEQVWGNLKGTELVNLCPDTIEEAADIADQGSAASARTPDLCFAFIRHTGLRL